MKTQQEVNNFFQENTVHVSAIYQIVQYLKDFNLKLPNNVILNEKGIDQAYFFKWFDNGPFKPGDVLVSKMGNLVLFSHLEKDVVYYHCLLNPFGCFKIVEKTDCGVGNSNDCYLASYSQKQRLLDKLKSARYEFDAQTNSLKKIAKYPDNILKCEEALNFKETFSVVRNVPFKYYFLLGNLGKLLICRDAYWKIAGEEMGLGKPWEPNWTTFEGMPAIFRFRYNIVCDSIKNQHCLLVFPTEEMRDAFYENFKDLIEQCKELL